MQLNKERPRGAHHHQSVLRSLRYQRWKRAMNYVNWNFLIKQPNSQIKVNKKQLWSYQWVHVQCEIGMNLRNEWISKQHNLSTKTSVINSATWVGIIDRLKAIIFKPIEHLWTKEQYFKMWIVFYIVQTCC